MIPNSLYLQKRNSKNDNSTPDIVVDFTVSTFFNGKGVGYNYAALTWNSADGTEYSKVYWEDIRPGALSDMESFSLQFEVKTISPRTDENGINYNIKALRRGINQIEGRLDAVSVFDPVTTEGVLLTDRDAYLNIVNAANNGNNEAKSFIGEVENYVNDGGRILLMQDLNKMAKDQVKEIKSQINKME